MHTIFDETNPERLTLVDILRRRAQHKPEREAYTFLLDGEAKQVHMTYANLDREARRIAALLQDCTPMGGRVLLLYPPGLEYITALFGCFYAGVVAVPAYPPRLNQSLKRIQSILQDAQITVALAPAKILTSVHRMLASDQFMAHIHWIATDTSDQEAGKSYQELRLDPSALALLQYTSGSTGSPKGVMLTHGNVMQNAALIQEGMGLSSKDRGLFWLPPYHDMGLMAGILQTLFTDPDPTVLMAPATFLQQPLRWLRAISSFQATISGGPNFAYDLCVKSATEETIKDLDLSSWAVAFTGAEPVREETLERFAQAFAPCGFRPEAFYPCYGLAETTLFVSGGWRSEMPKIGIFERETLETGHVVEATGDQKSGRSLVSCGYVRHGQEVVIVDPEMHTRCAPSTIGEIWVRGPNVAKGYWGKEEETAETFHAFLCEERDRHVGTGVSLTCHTLSDTGNPCPCSPITGLGPFLRTGDLGFCVDNELFVTGRLKDLIIIRGRNLYPQDIEQVVEKSHPLLRQSCCAVFAVEGARADQVVVVQEVVRHYGDRGVQEAIQAICQAVLSEFDVEVAAIELLRAGTIPKTTSGKIQRRACRSGWFAGELNAVYRWQREEHVGTGVSFAYHGQQTNGKPLSAPSHHALSRKGVTHSSKLSAHERGPSPVPTTQEIVDWLVLHIAERAHMDAHAVDLHAPFVQFGLNSLEAIGLSGELEQWLGRSLSPTLVYDYPTIFALAGHLAGADQSVETNHSADKHHARQTDAIAIIGLGCRFPGAPNPEAFWQVLYDGVDAISEIPVTRWDAAQFYAPDQVTPGKMNTRWGGFLPDIELFDPSFFHISPREARHMDPQQRLLLEVAWETLENAGQAPDKLAGRECGVFIGISSDDYAHLHLKNAQLGNAYVGTGNAHSIAANRLSYALDLRGPSMAIDTACSSSLVAVHQACQSLRNGECDLALAGGVNVLLLPELMVTFSQARMMSSAGHCKAFDEVADGYVRGEGCGLVLLKPLADALRDGDTVLAIVRGSAVNQDGRSNGLTAPNGPSQEAVIRRALHHAGVHPSAISYVETHGSSTSLGDPIEVDALKAVLMQERSPEQSCLLGAVKTNIGHLEAAAGIAGLIKTVLCLQKGVIAPNLHFKTLNPHISFAGATFEIPTEPRQWPGRSHAQRFAGVSAFGFGGTNAHVILEGPPQTGIVEADRADPCPERCSGQRLLTERSLHLLTISGRTAQALSTLAQRYHDFLIANPTVSISDLCRTAQTGRTHFAHRLAVFAENTEQLRECLAAFVACQPPKEMQIGQAQHPPALAFLFTGQGSQYAHMGHQLYETQPTFRQALDECNHLLRSFLPQPVGQALDLLAVHYPASGTTSLLNETVYAQPALFALEYALAQMWLSWGIKPDVVMGHSVGEYVAACLAGAFSLEDGLKLIMARGRLMQALPERGAMAVIWAEPERVQSFLAPYEAYVSLAALNGPNQTVISGRAEEIQLITQRLEASGARTHMLSVLHAFHSPMLDPMLDAFEQVAREVTFAPLRLPLACNLTGQLINTGETLDAHYWRRQTREAIQFATGIQTLAAHGYELFLELGPNPVLSNLGKRCLPGNYATWLPSLQQDHDDWHILMQSIASLYCQGCNLNWSNIDGNSTYRKIALPTYPFEREYCWFESEESNEKDTGRDRVAWTNKANRQDHHAVLEEHTGKSLIDFGLIFFSSSEASANADIYQLVIESARYADQHGFSSIWIPERHFTKEGWLYPNPVALTAALARETGRIHLRAGSVVVPLHHPLRIAEDWAMVDHLSGGRVGVSFASGWHPNDFALAPENYADRSEVMYRNIEIVRKLWRGEAVPFKGGDEQLVELKTFPLSLQHEIPIWLTAAGNPATFANAGKLGANLLTHMYNQSVDKLAEKIRIYRDARAEHGHDPATGKVSVMIHTYIGADIETVRAQVQGPFSNYLKSASYLVNAIAYSRGQQADLSKLSEQELDDYLAFVTDRLIDEQRVLFGTPQTCAPLVTQLQLAGVDEIACQMDFGIESDLVLRSLPYLNQLRELCNAKGDARAAYPVEARLSPTQLKQEQMNGSNGWYDTTRPQTIPDPGSQNEINSWLYQLRWEAIDLPKPIVSTSPGHWLVFLDHEGIGQRLSMQLQEQGHTCTLIEAGQNFHILNQHHYQVNPASPQQIKQAVRTALAVVRQDPKQTVGTALASVRQDPQQAVGTALAAFGRMPLLRGVIHLWSMDTTPIEALNPTRLLTDQILSVQSALSLIQALVEEAVQTRLWLITQGAQPVPAGEKTDASSFVPDPYTDLAVSQAPIWGLGKTCAMEHPEIWGGLIDLDPHTGSVQGTSQVEPALSAPATSLLTVLQGDWHEDQIALRGGKTYVSRLVRVEVGLASTLHASCVLHLVPDAAYLITGGLWGIGLECARWLAMRGARHLILLGRSKLPPRETWEQVPPESRQGIQIAGIRVIEQLGAHIHAASVDVTDESQLAPFFQQYQQQGMPPIRGIIHAASVWQNAQGQSRVKPLVNLDAEDLTAVLRPKMLGGWLLSNLLQETPLDFFISFSSAATLFGSTAQGNYAAASEFLDVLAYYQRAHGQPALSIDWGAISEIGYGATPGGLRVHEYWESHGIGRLSPQQVLAALELLLQEDLTRVGVLRLDWQLLRQSYPQMAGLPLVSRLVSGREETGEAVYEGTHNEPDANNGINVLKTLRDAYKEEHTTILTSYVKAQIATILRIPAHRLEIEEPLPSLGFDSLMAIELKNRLDLDLQIHLPIATLLQGPSITQLVKQVLALVPSRIETVGAQTEAPTGTVGIVPGSNPIPTELLSHNQKALWFLSLLSPESTAYNLLYVARIQQHLDVPALQRALQVLAARYPILTATYTLQNGTPVQQTHANQTLPLEVIDAHSRSLEDLKCLLLEKSNRPIDLTEGLVLRLQLYQRAEDDYLLGFMLHHIVADFWALELLVDELSLLYAVEKMDIAEPSRLPDWRPSDFQHADYVHWQQSMLGSSEGEEHWQYWHNVLAGDLPVLNLPTDRPRPPLQTYKGATQSFSFNTDLVKRLRSVANREKVTLFTLMLTAYQVLLHRHSHQDDILVGTPALGRTHSAFERVIGSLSNPVVVRARMGQNPTFKELLQQTKQSLLTALEHQDFPFSLLVERLQPQRDPSTSPIYQTLFIWDRPRTRNGEERAGHSQAGQGQVLSLRAFAYGQQGAQTDLTLTIFEIEDRLSADFRYNVDLFDADTIARMALHFLTLLNGIINNPDQHILELPLLPDNVRRMLLTECNATRCNYPQDLCVHQLFERQVEQTPEAIAVVFEDTSLTYQELNSHANHLAHRLLREGVGPEVLVGICMERSLELVVALLAVLKAGGAYLPLDPTYPAERLARILADAQPSVVLTQQRLSSLLPECGQLTVCLDAQRIGDNLTNPLNTIDAEHTCYVIYTSGSTGTPKGVMVSHRNVVNFFTGMDEHIEASDPGIWLAVTSISFDISVLELFWTLTRGFLVVLHKPSDEATVDTFWPAQLLEYGVSHLQCTPSFMHMILLDSLAPLALKGLSHLMLGGEELPLSLVKQIQALTTAKLQNMYGPTETTIWSTTSVLSAGAHAVSLGGPLANTQIYLLDAYLEPVPIGVAGEIYIGGEGLARGYLHRPDLTAERFLPNPFAGVGGQGQGPVPTVEGGGRLYRTGDLARYRADGTLEYLGRIDQQVKLRGFRIELGEIEATLRAYPAVQEAVVVLRQEPERAAKALVATSWQQLVAYVVAASGEEKPTHEDLRTHLRRQLPAYMVPTSFVFLDMLPLTPNGKIDRKALPMVTADRGQPCPPSNESGKDIDSRHLPAGRVDTPNPKEPDEIAVGTGLISETAPQTPLQEQLAMIWAELLHLPQVNIHSNFFDLGGHSLLAARLMVQIQTTFEVKVPLRSLFESPTLAEMASVIEWRQNEIIEYAQNDYLEELLANLEILSDEQVHAMVTTPLELTREREKEEGSTI